MRSRGFAIAIALLLVLAIGFWLVRRDPGPGAVSSEPASDSHPEIDDASRAALDEILEQSDREEGGEDREPQVGTTR